MAVTLLVLGVLLLCRTEVNDLVAAVVCSWSGGAWGA